MKNEAAHAAFTRRTRGTLFGNETCRRKQHRAHPSKTAKDGAAGAAGMRGRGSCDTEAVAGR